MSTRAAIVISNRKQELGSDPEKIILFHHCDGYPGCVGSELVDYLRKFCNRQSEMNELKSNFMQRSYDWSPGEIAIFITERDMSYRVIDSVPNVVEYIYVIDTSAKRLSCYSHDGYSAVDLDMLGDKLEIPDNEFDGSQNNVKLTPDYSQMFKTCSLASIDGDDIVFTDGTRVPVSQFGVPMHDPPFQGLKLFPDLKPVERNSSRTKAHETLETYKRVFVILLLMVLRRESYPFDFDRVITLTNELTCKVMQQFSKMKDYYSEHI